MQSLILGSRLSLLGAVLLACTACGAGDDDDDDEVVAAYQLQILHKADGEAGVDAVDDLPRFAAILASLRAERPERTLTVSAGDNWIPGVFYNAGSDSSIAATLDAAGQGNQGRSNGPGRPDIAAMNLMGFQASAFGNHEFDNGTDAVTGIIASDIRDAGASTRWLGAQFPYLSANLDFTGSALASQVVTDAQVIDDASTLAGAVAKSVVIRIDGEPIGIVGVTTPLLHAISSPDGIAVAPSGATSYDDADYDALATIIQSAVDQLTAAGVDKVVLLSHMQQYAIEADELAPRLEGVDVIVGGGSNAIFADDDDTLRSGDSAVEDYPVWRSSAVTGHPVAVVNTDGNWRYVGRLNIAFDEAGVIIRELHDSSINGAYATDTAGLQRVTGASTPDPAVAAITSAVEDVIADKDGTVFGYTTVYLNGLRGEVRTQETNLGNLSAEANLWKARQSDDSVRVSLKNGGGIRDSIGAFTTGDDPQRVPPPGNAFKPDGAISQLDIENSLRFNNDLVMITLTAEQLRQVLEHGVAGNTGSNTPGQFAQVAGVRYEWDLNGTAGASRIRNATIDSDGNGVFDGADDILVNEGALAGDPTRTVRVVTLGFLEGGGDSYPFPDFAAADPAGYDLVPLDSAGGDGFLDEAGEQQALADFLHAIHPDAASAYAQADQPDASLDTRIVPLHLIDGDG